MFIFLHNMVQTAKIVPVQAWLQVSRAYWMQKLLFLYWQWEILSLSFAFFSVFDCIRKNYSKDLNWRNHPGTCWTILSNGVIYMYLHLKKFSGDFRGIQIHNLCDASVVLLLTELWSYLRSEHFFHGNTWAQLIDLLRSEWPHSSVGKSTAIQYCRGHAHETHWSHLKTSRFT